MSGTCRVGMASRVPDGIPNGRTAAISRAMTNIPRVLRENARGPSRGTERGKRCNGGDDAGRERRVHRLRRVEEREAIVAAEYQTISARVMIERGTRAREAFRI